MSAMTYVKTKTKKGDADFDQLEDTLQATILSDGYVSAEAVESLVGSGIITAGKFHILGTRDDIPHSQKLLRRLSLELNVRRAALAAIAALYRPAI